MSGSEALALAMFLSFIVLVFTGFPIAWVLGGLAVLFTALGIIFEVDLGIVTHVERVEPARAKIVDAGLAKAFQQCMAEIACQGDITERRYPLFGGIEVSETEFATLRDMDPVDRR